MERTFEVSVTLINGETLNFRRKTNDRQLIILSDEYVLTNYAIYKRKGNVLCAEKLEYMELTIKIIK